MFFRGMCLSGVFVAAIASAASAATFTMTGGVDYTLPGEGLINSYSSSISTPGIGIGTLIRRDAELSLDAPSSVRFDYFGSEARYRNIFQIDGTTYFDNKTASNPSFSLDLGAGVVPLAFSTVAVGPLGTFLNGRTSSLWGSVAFLQTAPDVVWALFNDVALVDRDFDDFVVRMEATPAPVPIPAAGLMLMGALAGLGLVRKMPRARALRPWRII